MRTNEMRRAATRRTSAVLSLQEAGRHVVVIDNLVNSSEESLRPA